MAVTQISRIQHRRGLEQDLPQLASAELGWSIDTRRLYIGNGTLDEGAPAVGITRILTEHDIATITSDVELTDYTFFGNSAGYAVQTGPSAISPIIRTLQDKLDDFVSVKDFGATGNGVTDDTSAINRAIQQIYKSGVSSTEPRTRRTIYFPGGTYLISSPILIPPYSRLVGDGMGSAILKQTQGNRTVANVCDSEFQTGSSIGSGSATYPQDIEISGIQFFNSNTNVILPVFVIDSASNVTIQSSKFLTNATAGFYPNLVSVQTSTGNSNKITFDSCQFINGGNGISLLSSSVTSVRVVQSGFDNLSNVAAHLGSSLNFSSIGNYIGSAGGYIVSNGNNNNFALGDYFQNDSIKSGLYVGNLQITPTQQYTLSSTPLVLAFAGNSAAALEYEIRKNANVRLGTFTITPTGTNTVYDDSYTETNVPVDANFTANTNSLIVSVNSGTAIFKFNFRRFI